MEAFMSSYRLNNTLKTKIKKTLLLSLITLPITASAHTYTDHHSHLDKKHHSLKEHTTTSHYTAQQHTPHSNHHHKSETEHKSAIHHKATHELKSAPKHHSEHSTHHAVVHEHHKTKRHEVQHHLHTKKRSSVHKYHHIVKRKHTIPVDYFTTAGHYGHHHSMWSSLMHFRLPSRIKSKIWHSYERWAHTPYRYGGTTHRGIDCSAFVRRVFSEVFHIHLPRTSLQQVKLGFKVKKENAHYGDLVFFKTEGSHHHVGIYLDHGRFVNATSSRGVAISNINHPYWRKRLWQIRRLVAA